MSSVPTWCFGYCSSLASFTFGANLTSLGSTAFYNCKVLDGEVNLQYVTSIGSSAFLYCYAITGVTFSLNLSTIGTSALESCTSLTGNINMPISVTTVGARAFRNTKITSLTFLGDSTVITPGQWYDYAGRGYRTLR